MFRTCERGREFLIYLHPQVQYFSVSVLLIIFFSAPTGRDVQTDTIFFVAALKYNERQKEAQLKEVNK